MVQKGNSLATAFSGVIPNSVLSSIIDSGATDHMIGGSKLFSSYSPCAGNKKVKIADGSLSVIAGIGTIKLTSLLTLHDVLHVPNLSCNLLSISKFTSDHLCQANFYSSYCEFQELTTRRMIGNAKEKDGLCYFDDGPNSSRRCQSTCLNSISGSKNNDIMLRHYRLGHPSFQYLKHLFPNLFRNKSPSFELFNVKFVSLLNIIVHLFPSNPTNQLQHLLWFIAIFRAHVEYLRILEKNGLWPLLMITRD